MPESGARSPYRYLLVVAAAVLCTLPTVHAGQTACVQHDALGRVVSKGGAPLTCAGKNCGTFADGCGGTLNCGTCGPGQTCNGGCCASSCASKGMNCGTTADGCGGFLYCGACASGQVCTTANVCCAPTTCAAQGKSCGTASDGCGGTLTCGTCGAGSVCQANVCVNTGTCAAVCDVDCILAVTNTCAAGFSPNVTLTCRKIPRTGVCTDNGGGCTCQ